MTYEELKNTSKKILLSGAEKSEDTAAFEADTLVLFFSGLSKSRLIFEKKTQAENSFTDKVLSASKSIAQGMPLQYVISEWEFFGNRIFCGKGCLIPRPETELLVEKAIEELPHGGRFLDLCTGSGCISTAVLNARKDSSCVSVDISEDALKYAEKNRDYYNLKNRMSIVLCDAAKFDPGEKFDLIISNPPYIKSADIQNLEKCVLQEPLIALDGGSDGLYFYKMIVKKYADFLKDDGSFLFEIGYDISDGVKNILCEDGFCVDFMEDFHKILRVCIGKRQ